MPKKQKGVKGSKPVLSKHLETVLKTARKYRRKDGTVKLQALQTYVPVSMSDNSVTKKVSKLVKRGLLTRTEQRGVYGVPRA